eukprot:TRINITY_DN28940_c0_g1_i1.p1 TRINITY_DN28940_c0_g1~~TRINITY_DN28940_c0_g1_i1.p1  ORF type:complete len:534 (-),score=66.01 TRINITY_DN28940_c0_g1_i1:164-1537(-)
MALVKEDIDLDTEQSEIVVSVTLLLAAISTVIGIPLNSTLGRKPVIMLAALLYIGGSVIIGFAQDYFTLVCGRSFLGVAIGFASGTVPMYSAEVAPPEMRGMVVTLNDLNIVFGQLIAALMNVLFKSTEGGWRWSMGLAACPALVLLVGFLFLPESPRWLVMKGRMADAEAVLRMISKQDDVSQPLEEILTGVRKEDGQGDGDTGLIALLRRAGKKMQKIWMQAPVRRAALLGLGLMAMNQLSGINTVMYYSTTILVEAGFSRDSSIWLAAMCCAAQLVGVVISVCSMDTSGRRPTALRSCAGVVIMLALLSMSFLAKGDSWDIVKVVALAGYLVAFGSGLSGVPWVMNAEIYPLRLRSAAVGQATVFNWILNWFVGRYFLNLCALVGTGGAFSVFAFFSIVGGVWMYVKLPETMGLSLEEISSLFSGTSAKQMESDTEASSSESNESEQELCGVPQ